MSRPMPANGDAVMMWKVVLLVSAPVLAAEAAVAQPATDQVDCQKRIDQIASAIGVPKVSVNDGHFRIGKANIAIVSGQCDRSLSVEPASEPFDAPPSPAYRGLAARVTASAFALRSADAKQAITACLNAAVPDPPRRLSKAGFATQRWRNSRMTGSVTMHGFKWNCTYHNSNKLASSVEITKSQ